MIPDLHIWAAAMARPAGALPFRRRLRSVNASTSERDLSTRCTCLPPYMISILTWSLAWSSLPARARASSSVSQSTNPIAVV